MAGLLARGRIIAGPAFNRWLVPPASVAIHLCIGSVHAWSIYNPALIGTEGVVTPAAGDLGILVHELWLVYLGYGVIGGCGLGLGYVSPVSTLIRWFSPSALSISSSWLPRRFHPGCRRRAGSRRDGRRRTLPAAKKNDHRR